MRLLSNVVFIAVMCCWCSAGAQTTYKCVSDKGSVTFQDFPCKTGKAEAGKSAVSVADTMKALAERCRTEDSIGYHDRNRCVALRSCAQVGRSASELSICTEERLAWIISEAAKKAEMNKRYEKLVREHNKCMAERRAAYVAGVRPIPICD